jgi:hypothetical protein
MILRQLIPRGLKALFPARRQSPPAPRGPVTSLQPFTPPAAPAELPHPDTAIVMADWKLHQRHTPHLTFQTYLNDILPRRNRFFHEERMEREAKLAQLNALATRPKL